MKLTFKSKKEFAEAIIKYGKLHLYGGYVVIFDAGPRNNPFYWCNSKGFELENSDFWNMYAEEWSTTPPLKDKDLVWCWDDMQSHIRHLMFYDAVNSRCFSHNGERKGMDWDNIEKYKGEWPEWAKEAVKTLED